MLGPGMIDLYTWSTPNGRKASIALEELGLAYTVHPVDISKGEQFTPQFLAINPNNKIPAIVDPDGPEGRMALFETGAILVYLAEKTGQLMPAAGVARYEVLTWLMWQKAGFGPMLGQAHHFRRAVKTPNPYGVERYTNEAKRLYGVLDQRLEGRAFVAGGAYSIADIAIYPWAHRHDWQGIALDEYPNVRRWFDAVGARPAVQAGMQVPKKPA